MAKCCFCKKNYFGYGHNAEPIMKGKCCEDCNDKWVLPVRFVEFMREQRKKQRGKKK